MKTFKWPLLILLVLTAVALGAYWLGLVPKAQDTYSGIHVSVEHQNGDRILHIRLDHAGTRTHWQAKGDRYRVDIHRRGPDLYRFKIALINPKTGHTRRLEGAATVGKQPVTVGGFTDPRGQTLSHDDIVIQAR